MNDDTRELALALCEALDLTPETITRLVLTVDVGEPYPILELEQVITEPAEVDGDQLTHSLARFELHRKETP